VYTVFAVILFVAAFAPELVALAADVERETVGVGLVEAALGATRAIARRRPSGVVLVGTVGAYADKGLSIGDVVVATRVRLASPTGELLAAMSHDITTDASLTARANARHVTVATTLAITTDDRAARALADSTGADVEHLEAFSVARACQEASVPFTAVFGVANMVGSSGRAEWREHHERAAAAACAIAAPWKRL